MLLGVVLTVQCPSAVHPYSCSPIHATSGRGTCTVQAYPVLHADHLHLGKLVNTHLGAFRLPCTNGGRSVQHTRIEMLSK